MLLDGLAYVESPRWHEDRLWFAHWGTEEIVAVDLDGNSEVVGHGAPALGWSIDWLPDGRLLVTGRGAHPPRARRDDGPPRRPERSRRPRLERDRRGRPGQHLREQHLLRLHGREEPPLGIIALVTPDGAVRQVADGIEFPNGMVVTPDNSTLIVSESFAGRLTAFDIDDDGGLSNRRVWAEGIGPDSISMDAEGAIWTHSADTRTHTGRAADPEGECVRVFEGGEIRERIVLDRAGFACTLGGPDRRTLFMLAAEWEGTGNVDDVIARRTGQVLVADAPAPGVGWP